MNRREEEMQFELGIYDACQIYFNDVIVPELEKNNPHMKFIKRYTSSMGTYYGSTYNELWLDVPYKKYHFSLTVSGHHVGYEEKPIHVHFWPESYFGKHREDIHAEFHTLEEAKDFILEYYPEFCRQPKPKYEQLTLF